MKQIAFCTLLLFALAAGAQTSTPPAAAPTPATTLTLNAPSACTSSATCTATVWYCAGTAAQCSVTAAVWKQIGTVTGLVNGTPGSFTDTAEPLNAAATYTVEYTQGTTDSGPLPTYTGTPTPPLAGGSFSGSTS